MPMAPLCSWASVSSKSGAEMPAAVIRAASDGISSHRRNCRLSELSVDRRSNSERSLRGIQRARIVFDPGHARRVENLILDSEVIERLGTGSNDALGPGHARGLVQKPLALQKLQASEDELCDG